jgi:hypothetical protein
MIACAATYAVGSIMQGNTAKALGELQQQAYNVQAENTRKAASFEAMQTMHKNELAALKREQGLVRPAWHSLVRQQRHSRCGSKPTRY